MGNCDAHYRYVTKTAAQTAALCRDLQNKRVPEKETVRRDRLQEIAVRRMLAEELYEVFITPLDREDLFMVCERMAQVLYELQQIAVVYGSAPLSQAVWSTVCGIADAVYEAAKAFSDGKTPSLFHAAAQVQNRIVQIDRYAGRSEYEVIVPWLRCCREATVCMVAATLKNT